MFLYCSQAQSDYTVLLGEHDTLSTSGDEIFVSVSSNNIFTHPLYDASLNLNDIALLRMNNVIMFNENIAPACRPHEDLEDDMTLLNYAGTVSGWGMTGYSTYRIDFILAIYRSIPLS